MERTFFYSLKFGLVIVAATLLGSCLSAPRKQLPDAPWWFSPCDTEVPDLTDLARLRHGRSTRGNTAEVATVKTQLKIFVNQLKIGMRKIDRLYTTKKGPSKGPNAKLKWLKIKKMLTEMKRAKVQPRMLEKFQVAIQHFAGTLEVLRGVQIKTDVVSFNQSGRYKIYTDIAYQLRILLCELANIGKPEDKVPKIPLKAMRIPLKNTMDYTEAHIVDFNFFKKTLGFFKKSQATLFRNKKVKPNDRVVKKQQRTT